MSIFLWIALGIIIGVVSRFLDTEDTRGGLLGSILFGISGSVAGGLAAMLLLGGGLGFVDITSFIIVLSTSVLLLMIQRTVFSKQERF